jgi:hypothetical protein
VRIPWEERATAISSGLDPASLTERAARRRAGDAGLGREVAVPVYLLRLPGSAVWEPPQAGVPVRLSAGGGTAVDRGMLPADFPNATLILDAVHEASGDPRAVRMREGWTRVGLGSVRQSGLPVALVLRDSDWALLRAALTLRARSASEPQDAPVERVAARFLGRLDGLDGTSSAGLWGRLALEVVTVRRPERLADTRSLRWHASWGRGGFAAGSDGTATGSAGHEMLLDLTQQQITVYGRPFRVRTLPDWEREQTAHDLRLSSRLLMAWPVVSLSTVLAYFEDISPAALATERPQDAPSGPHDRRGPQDAR